MTHALEGSKHLYGIMRAKKVKVIIKVTEDHMKYYINYYERQTTELF